MYQQPYGRSRFAGRGRPNHQHRSFRPAKAKKIKSLDVSFLTRKAETPKAAPEVYVPHHQFTDFPVNEVLKRNIVAKGYTEPTPIQDQAIPHLLNGKDVVGIANTGTGKTAAFLIPLLHKVMQDRSQKVLIIAPTRELATQIKQEAMEFTRGTRVFSALCIGGVSMFRQIDSLRRHPELVIGTPGRLNDLYKQGRLEFSEYSTIVLDEVDRMLDMGFIHDIRFIVSHLPEQRQSVFFSATLSASVRSVMHTFLRNPITISVKSQETSLNVDQDVVRTHGRDKIEVLHEILSQREVEKAIVFGRTKRGVEKLSRQLDLRGFSVVALHGNKNQNQRQRALDMFKRNHANVMLATDVAARGLDIADVTHVINYDLPETYEDYVHRIGRTGRANRKGIALSFVD